MGADDCIFWLSDGRWTFLLIKGGWWRVFFGWNVVDEHLYWWVEAGGGIFLEGGGK